MTNKDRKQRQEAAEQAIASARLAGFVPTVEDLALNRLWIDGELTTEELIGIHKERLLRHGKHD